MQPTEGEKKPDVEASAGQADGTGPDKVQAESPAERLIAQFGGIRPMAAKLGVPATTVQGWKKRGVIPDVRRSDIRRAAAANDIVLDDRELEAALHHDRDEEGVAEGAETSTAGAGGREKATGGSTRKTEGRSPSGPGGPSGPGSPTPPPPPGAPRRDGATLGVAVVALVVAVMAFVGLLTYPEWSPRYLDTPDARTLSDRLASVESDVVAPIEATERMDERLTAMEAEVDDALERIDRFTGVEIDGQPLDEILAGLDDRLDGLDAGLANLADDAEEEIQALRDRLDARIPALEDRVVALEGEADAFDDVARRVESLEAERAALGDVRQAVDSLARQLDELSGGLEETDTRLEEIGGLTEQLAATDSSTMALVLAVGQLREALATGAPYERHLETVAAVSDEVEVEESLQVLEPYAEAGAPTLAELQSAFPAMARHVREEAAAPENGSWQDEAMSRIRNLVTVRPAPGEVEGDDVQSILARAEARIRSDNLRGAVSALEGLDGSAAEAAEDWIGWARDRIALEDALDSLNDTAVSRLLAERDGGSDG